MGMRSLTPSSHFETHGNCQMLEKSSPRISNFSSSVSAMPRNKLSPALSVEDLSAWQRLQTALTTVQKLTSPKNNAAEVFGTLLWRLLTSKQGKIQNCYSQKMVYIYIYGMVIRPSFRILYNGWINRYGLPFPFWQKKPVSHFLGSVEFGDEAQITHKMAHVRGKMMIKHDQLVDLWMTHPMVFSINPGSRIHIGATDMFCFNRDFTGIQTVDLLGYYGDIMGYRITWYLDW